MTFPKELEITYNNKVREIEEEFQVSYMTTAERIGFEEGIRQGLQQGVQQGMEQGFQKRELTLIQSQLRIKFSHIPDEYLQLLMEADAATLLAIGNRILAAKEIEEVFVS